MMNQTQTETLVSQKIEFITRYDNDTKKMHIIEKSTDREITAYDSCHDYQASHKSLYINNYIVILPVLPGCIFVNLKTGATKRLGEEIFGSFMVYKIYYLNKILITDGMFWGDSPSICFFNISPDLDCLDCSDCLEIEIKRLACINLERESIDNIEYKNELYIITGTSEEFTEDYEEDKKFTISKEYNFVKTYDLQTKAVINEVK